MIRAGLLLAALAPLATASVPAFVHSPTAGASRPSVQSFVSPAHGLRAANVGAPRLRRASRIASMAVPPEPRDREVLLQEALALNLAAETNEALQMTRRMALRSAFAASLGVAAIASTAPTEAKEDALLKIQEADPLGLSSDFNVAPGRKIVLPAATVEKSLLDRREYRALTLANGMRVLLASDPKADQAAAALDVHVGHYSDPAEIPGLAHFCEHMLFLGTEKYPEEGALDRFLSKNGGQNNAFTANGDTTYFFSINQNALEPALDIFSSFFVAPLFTASGVERELNAIESEHAKNLQTDSWRVSQVGKLRYNQEHPVAKFGTGNKFTLKDRAAAKGIDLRAELLKWHDEYYSANMMTLAVTGREDLDTLEKWVTDKFSAVPNKDVPPPEARWAGRVAPIDPVKAAKETYAVVPVQDDRAVTIEWILPYTGKEERQARVEAKPQNVIGALLGHEGPGSLLSYLKNERGLVTSLGASTFEEDADYISFGAALELTPEGLRRKDEVLAAVCDYLDMLRTKGIPDYTYAEVAQMSEINFRFKETGSPLSFAISSGTMHKYPPAKYLSGPATFRGVTKGQVAALLAQMTPERALVTTVARDVAPLADKTEFWYKAKYGVLPSPRLATGGAAALAGKLALPPPNPFIPAQFALKQPVSEALSDPVAPPAMLVDSPAWRVHFKGDRRYGQPKGVAYFQISQPDEFFAPDNAARTSAYARLLKSYLTDYLREDTYAASEAGLQYSCDFTAKGLRLEFAGYSDKLPQYVASVTSKIAAFVPQDESRMARYKDVIARELDAYVTQQPYQHANYIARQCTDLPSFLPPEVAAELARISFKDLQAWAGALWDRGFGEALVQGNFDEGEALAMVQRVESAFSFTPVPPEQRAGNKVVELPVGRSGYGQMLVQPDPNAGEVNSAVLVQFQNPSESLKEQMAMLVISSVIDQPFFADLRTKQQLGYIVGASARAAEDVTSLTFTVQSAVADATEVTKRIFAFVDGFATTALRELPQEAFEASVRGLVAKKLQTDKSLGAEAARHWGEIAEGQYKYARAQEEVTALRALTLADVQGVFTRYLAQGGEQRRALTTVVYAAGKEGSGTAPDGSVLVADAKAFRAARPFVARAQGRAPALASRTQPRAGA